MVRRRFVVAAVLYSVVILTPFVAHFVSAALSDRWADLMEAYEGRSAGSGVGHFVSNTLWRLYALHSPPLVIVTFLWLWRVARRRLSDAGTLVMLALFLGQSIWLAVMRTEFLVHEYRSYWYVAPAAFASADVGMRWMRSLRQSASSARVRRQAPAIVLVALLGWGVWHVRHNLVTSRRMAGAVSYQQYQPRHELMTAARLVH